MFGKSSGLRPITAMIAPSQDKGIPLTRQPSGNAKTKMSPKTTKYGPQRRTRLGGARPLSGAGPVIGRGRVWALFGAPHVAQNLAPFAKEILWVHLARALPTSSAITRILSTGRAADNDLASSKWRETATGWNRSLRPHRPASQRRARDHSVGQSGSTAATQDTDRGPHSDLMRAPPSVALGTGAEFNPNGLPPTSAAEATGCRSLPLAHPRGVQASTSRRGSAARAPHGRSITHHAIEPSLVVTHSPDSTSACASQCTGFRL